MNIQQIKTLYFAAAMTVVMSTGTAVHGDVMYSGKFTTTDYWDGGNNHDAIFDEADFDLIHGFYGGWSSVLGNQKGVEFEFRGNNSVWYDADCTISFEMTFNETTEITLDTYWGGGGAGPYGFDVLYPLDGDGIYIVEAGESFYYEAYAYAQNAELLVIANLTFNPVKELCISDCNQDYTVNVLDLLYLLGVWGTDDPAGDINSDGSINVDDLLILISDWGDCA